MQQLQSETVAPSAADGCAHAVLAAAPAAMRFIRSQMRAHRHAALTVPQFRALVFASHHDDGSLSELAEQLGLSLPTASRMVQGLVRRGLLVRRARSSDRRSVALSLTARGRAAFRAAHRATQAALARRFETLSPAELTLVSEAMGILSRVFAAEDCRGGSIQ